MCAAPAHAVVRRNGMLMSGLAFALQVFIAVSAEVADDVGRATFSQHGTAEGVNHARDLVAFETAHGFFVEPAWQMFFLRPFHLLVFAVSRTDMIGMMNGIYVLGHVFFTLGVALWVYMYRRRWFGLLRNTVILVNVYSLCIYENFPVAPPRLTTGIIFGHHPFVFRDTVFGSQSGYNEFSALPSVHIAWALVAGVTLFMLSRSLAPKIAGIVYPVCMGIAVVATGNHYLLDEAGGAIVTVFAFATAWSIDRWWNNSRRDGGHVAFTSSRSST